jgi:hypothetical protein
LVVAEVVVVAKVVPFLIIALVVEAVEGPQGCYLFLILTI